MNKINQTSKQKVLYNICVILCIQVCLSVLSAAMEFVLWDGLLKNGDCGAGYLALGVVFLSIPAVPIVLCLTARKYCVYPDGIRYTLLSALPVPLLIFLVGCCFTESHNFRWQGAHYFLNPLVHSSEYIVEMFSYSAEISVKSLAKPALCLAQLTEVAMLMLGMWFGKRESLRR